MFFFKAKQSKATARLAGLAFLGINEWQVVTLHSRIHQRRVTRGKEKIFLCENSAAGIFGLEGTKFRDGSLQRIKSSIKPER